MRNYTVLHDSRTDGFPMVRMLCAKCGQLSVIPFAGGFRSQTLAALRLDVYMDKHEAVCDGA